MTASNDDMRDINLQIATKQAHLAPLLDGIEDLEGDRALSRAGAIKTANDEISSLIDRRDVMRAEIKASRSGGRQVIPHNDDTGPDGSLSPRLPGPDWGSAVIAANEAQGGMRGVKSFITAGTATVATTVGGPIADPRRARFLSDLIPSENAPGGHFSYLRQTVRTNNAAVVAASALKPTSVYSLLRVDDTTKVVAHMTEPIVRQDLDDSAVLRQFLNDELKLGLDLVTDARIVAAIIAAGPLVEGDIGTTLDTTRRSLTRLQEREIDPSAFLLAPRDWEQIEGEAQATFAANANMAPATDAVRRTLHGIPVFLSNAVPENTGYLGDFRTSAKVYTTGPTTIDWSEGHFDSVVGATDFERNLVRFRAERRIEVAILRTFAFVQINLAATGS